MNYFEAMCIDKIASDPSRWQKGKGAWRAMRYKDEGIGKFVSDPELIGQRRLSRIRGRAIGTVTGAVVGLLSGLTLRAAKKPARLKLLTALGALLFGQYGAHEAPYFVNKQWLKERGITTKHLGMSYSFTPEAEAKYITPYLKKKKSKSK